jgi:preprotein translocase subunit YajC
VAALIILTATAVLWVFVFRVVKQRQIAAHHAFLASLQPGDRITTAGGIHGTVVAIDADLCRLEIAPGVVIDLVPIVINRRVATAGEIPAGTEPAALPDAVPTPDGDVRLDKD